MKRLELPQQVKDFFESRNEQEIPVDYSYIDQIINTVTVPNEQGLWRSVMRQWFVNAVAIMLTQSPDIPRTCPILCGGQGIGKSSFLKIILGDLFSEYSFFGVFEDSSMNDYYSMSISMYFIMLDGIIDNINDRSDLKELLCTTEARYMKPHDIEVNTYLSCASFIGASNEEFGMLVQGEDRRRIFNFQVASIDLEAARRIDMQKVWKQAYLMYMFTSQLNQLVLSKIRKPKAQEDEALFFSMYRVKKELADQSAGLFTKDDVRLAMLRLGFNWVNRKGTRGFEVVRVNTAV